MFDGTTCRIVLLTLHLPVFREKELKADEKPKGTLALHP